MLRFVDSTFLGYSPWARIPSLNIKILLASNPLNSRILVCGLRLIWYPQVAMKFLQADRDTQAAMLKDSRTDPCERERERERDREREGEREREGGREVGREPGRQKGRNSSAERQQGDSSARRVPPMNVAGSLSASMRTPAQDNNLDSMFCSLQNTLSAMFGFEPNDTCHQRYFKMQYCSRSHAYVL